MKPRLGTGVRVLLAAAAALCAVVARADSAATPGPWGLTYAHYRPALFGPERPLPSVLADSGITLDTSGRLDGARLLCIKAQRRCELWVADRMIKAYRIQLSQSSVGTKRRRGDQRTPEGDYTICAHRSSKYHRGLWLSYPNREDAERALRDRKITPAQADAIAAALDRGECPSQGTSLGGTILLHGQQRSLTSSLRRAKPGRSRRADLQAGDADPARMSTYHDWTSGCIALFNPDIRELYQLLPDGTQVRIVADGPVTAPASTESAAPAPSPRPPARTRPGRPRSRRPR